MGAALNVYVVVVANEDSANFGRIADMLRAFGAVVHCYGEAQDYLRSEHFRMRHVVVIDMDLEGMSSLDLIRLVAERSAATAVFAVAERPTIAAAVRAIKAGAYDFLEEPISVAPIIEILRNPWAGSPNLSGVSDVFMQVLTSRELEVVVGLLEGGSSKQIARALGISHRTVEVHRRHIFKKLQVASTAELILRNRTDARASTLNA